MVYTLHIATIMLVDSSVVFYVMGARPDVPRKPKSAQETTVVEVEAVELLDGPLVIETTREVDPHRVLSVASEVGGRIVWRHPNLRIGEHVQAGDHRCTENSWGRGLIPRTRRKTTGIRAWEKKRIRHFSIRNYHGTRVGCTSHPLLS